MRMLPTTIRHLVCVAALAGALTYASEAQAAPITVDSVGDSFTVDFDGNVNSTPIAGLSATATFTVTSFTANSIGFDVDLTNTSGSGITSRISGLGFDTTPGITGATSTGVFNIAVLGGAYPNGFGGIEACFKDGGGTSNCQGGGSGGVSTGVTGNFDIVLGFTGPITQFTFDKFGVRYQSIGGTTAGTSGTGTGTPRPPTSVPEPSSAALLGTGLVASLVARRRRR